MLFKKKDNAESSKAKNSLFARKAKSDVEQTSAMKPAAKKTASEGAKEQKSLKVVVAQGKINPNILMRPRITEKATAGAAQNVYVFDIAPRANKKQVAAAIRDVYGITPTKVRVTAIPQKTSVNRRGKETSTGGGKKAYVYLKQGDTIELI